MWFFVIAAIIMLIIIITVFESRTPRFDVIASLNGTDIESNVKRLAASLRDPVEAGAAPDKSAVLSAVKRAYKSIKRKIAIGLTVYECEKWLYENYYRIESGIKNINVRNFVALPHKHKQARLLILSKFIVESNNCDIDYEKIQKIIQSFNSHTPLFYEEILHLEEAVKYSLAVEIASVAAKIASMDRCVRAAADGRIIKRFFSNDAYVYELRQRGTAEPHAAGMRNAGVNYDNIDYAHTTTLINLAKKMANAVTGFKREKLIDDKRVIKLCYAAEKFASDEVFRAMDCRSQMLYLDRLAKLSSKINVSETTTLLAVRALAKEKDVYYGEILFEPKYDLKRYIKRGKVSKSIAKSEFLQRIVMAAVFGGAAIAALIPAIFAPNLLIALPFYAACFLALFKTAEHVVFSLHKTVLPPRPVPRLDSPTVAKEHATITLCSCLIADKDDIKYAVDNILSVREHNSTENVAFGLLVDFKSCGTQFSEADLELTRELEYSLKDYADVNIYIRKRTKIGTKYSGWERKRGAVMDLFAAVISGDYSAFSYVKKQSDTYVYAVLLDSDNQLLPDTVRLAVNTITHPLMSESALLTFSSRVNNYSIKTLYAKKYLRCAGMECYNNYSDYYYNLTGRSVFCGKGIVNISKYYKLLDKQIPENRILSHDILEGAILNSRSGGITVFEDVPLSFTGETERDNRWKRGDIGLIGKTGNSYRNVHGVRKKRVIEPIYKYVTGANAISIISDIALFALLLYAAYSGAAHAIITFFAVCALPFAVEAMLALNSTVYGVRPLYAFQAIGGIVARLILKIFTLPFYAVNNMALWIITTAKIVLKKDLMRWRTFRDGNVTSLHSHVMLILPSVIAMTLLSILDYRNIVLAAYSLCFIVTVLALYTGGNPIKSPKTKVNNNILKDFAEKTYAYFSENVKSDSDYLVPDHVQLRPYAGAADYTSPTNIGFSLLSEICAAELNLIDKEKCRRNLDNILLAISSLEKYKGNLFNWYSLPDKTVLSPRFVSSVDSGNLVACLITSRAWLKKNGYDCAVVTALIDETDLDVFYDKEKELYHIGYNLDSGKSEGHYDMLASEARLMNYIAAVRYRRVNVWTALSRRCSAIYGNTLMSWSGSMFEYLMPELFISEAYGTLMYGQIGRVIRAQKRNKCNKMYGISESAYFDFDDSSAYRYRAFGISDLAVRTEDNRCVISPYSSMLALPFDPEKSTENLLKIAKSGGYGKYGFYEAIDFTSGSGKVVATFMAHHLGMSLAALTNHLTHGAVTELFMSDLSVNSGKLLLTEPAVTNKGVKKITADYAYDKYGAESYCVPVEPARVRSAVNLLTSGKYAVMTDSQGLGYSKYGNWLVTRYRGGALSEGGVYVYLKNDANGEIYSPCYATGRGAESDYTAAFYADETVYVNKTVGIRAEVFVPHCISGEVRRIRVTNDTDIPVTYRAAVLADVILAGEDEYTSHPCFNNLFISTEFDMRRKAVIARKKSRDLTSERYCAAAIYGLSDVRGESNRFNAYKRCGSIDDINIFNAGVNPSFGGVLEPCLGLVGSLNVPPHGSAGFYAVIVAGEDKARILEQLDTAAMEQFDEYARELAKVKALSAIRNIGNGEQFNYLLTLAASVLSDIGTNADSIGLLQSVIKELGIDCRYKLILHEYDGDAAKLSFIAKAVHFLNCAFVHCTLAVVYNEEDTYRGVVRGEITDACGEGLLQSDCFKLFEISATGAETLRILRQFAVRNTKDSETDDTEYAKCKNVNGTDNKIEKIEKFENGVQCGIGKFAKDGYAIENDMPSLPFSTVVAGEKGGFIATDNGGGYTYFGNSRENKFNIWYNDPVTDAPSELIFVEENGYNYRINRGNVKGSSVLLSRGKITYNMQKSGLISCVEQYLIADGESKIIEVSLENLTDTSRKITLIYTAELCMGWRERSGAASCTIDGNRLICRNGDGYEAYISARDCTVLTGSANRASRIPVDRGKLTDEQPLIKRTINLCAGERVKTKIVIGISGADASLNAVGMAAARQLETQKIIDLNKFNLDTGIFSLDELFNNWLLYQVKSSRLNARAGYYQAGGAIGFRDQLQDCLAMLYSDADYVRRHILLSAERQYIEGDVMHWWHLPRYGVRTGISDDRLFLPYVTYEYIRVTGDKNILDEKVAFMESQPLEKGAEARLESPSVTEYLGSLSEHISRAIDSALVWGEHNLLLIGSGDWNDALNGIGGEGRGESVWLTMLCYGVLSAHIEFLPCDKRVKYLTVMDRMWKGIDGAFENGYFKRAYTDGGEWLGVSDGVSAQIDLLTQSFAVLSACADKDRAVSAIASAEKKLVDKKAGIIKLLAPPFNDKKYYGYISSYPEGVRENGGQYTHAAIWFISAVAKIDKNKAFDYFQMINPIEKCLNSDKANIYKGEPYVFSGDVYAGGDYDGRMGWSWYTGSAAWAYKVILEDLLGITKTGSYLLHDGRVPDALRNTRLIYKFKDAIYNITIAFGERRVELNGIKIGENKLPLKDSGEYQAVFYCD